MKNKRQNLILICLILIQSLYGWGHSGHRIINKEAISLLSSPLKNFFHKNKYFISENSIKPDLWKKDLINHPGESHGHYIDVDYYDFFPFDNIPRNFKDLTNKYGSENIEKWGTAPWRIDDYFKQLVFFFKNNKWEDVKIIASCLGHYVSDIHVPLHTTKNYNGQLTNNTGIHKRWETDLLDYFLLDSINVRDDSLYYFDNPIDQTFLIIIDSFSYIDSILISDSSARLNLNEKEILKIQNWDQSTIESDYIKKLYNENHFLVKSQMEKAVISVASFWEKAWIIAGKPVPPKK